MSSKKSILDNIKQQQIEASTMPKIKLNAVVYEDKIQQFIEMSRAVGGDAILLKEGEDINQVIKNLFPKALTIGSNIPKITCATFNPDQVDSPHKLNGTDLAIVKGEWGVAENAAVWIPQNVVHKALYFIAEELVIILDSKHILNNMHEAYQKISFENAGFGIFISGPSKTADIEQALVIGAHGARGVNVILY